MPVPEKMIDLGVCRLRHIQYVLTDHRPPVILFAQIFPSVHLVEAAVDFRVVISVTVTSISVRLELRATAILTQVVRIGLLYAALRGPRVLLKAVAFCGLARALRPSVTCSGVAAPALTNAAAG